MVNLRNLLINLTIVIAIVMTSFCSDLPAVAVTQELQIVSSDGYRVKTAFDYNQVDNSNAIAEQGSGATKAVNSMIVSFYNPDGEMMANYDNIVGGVVQGNYFEFNYDPKTQQLLGAIDLGGESAGEIYLKGDVEQGLHLIRVEASGEEVIMDNGQWTVIETFPSKSKTLHNTSRLINAN